MSKADVNYLSLVKRGANRSPIKIMKSEIENMLNLSPLHTLFGLIQKTEAPKVIAYVVKSEAADATRAALVGEGVELVESIQKTEDGQVATLFVAGHDTIDGDKCVILKMDENVCVVVENVQKSFSTMANSMSFNQNMQQQGFFPSLRLAMDILYDTLLNVAFDNKGQAVSDQTLVAQALEDFSQYVMGLLSSVPVAALKSVALPKVVEPEATAAAEGEEVQKTDGEGEEAPAEESTAAAEGTAAEEPAAATAAEGGEAPAAVEGTEAPATTEAPAAEAPASADQELAQKVDKLAASLAQLTQLITTSNDNVQSVAKSVEEVQRKVESVSQAQTDLGERVAKAESDLHGTAPLQHSADPQQEVQKSEQGSQDFLFDTAMPYGQKI